MKKSFLFHVLIYMITEGTARFSPETDIFRNLWVSDDGV
jgi:hypothetical protein